MSLLSEEELAAFAGVAASHPRLGAALVLSEVLVAAWIGAEELGRRELSWELSVPRFRRILELPQGPASELLSVSEEGEALAVEDFALRPWSLARPDGFRPGRSFQITATLGWARDEEPPLPGPLRQALLLTAAERLERTSSRLLSERLGDHAVTYAPPDALPAEVAALVQPWRRP